MKYTIYLDENLSPYVAEALNSLGKFDFPDIQVKSTIADFGRAIKDEKLIPAIGENNAVLITRDINMRRVQLERELLIKHKLGVFFIDLPKGQSRHWDIVLLLVRYWQDVVREVRSKNRPYIYFIKPKSGVKPYSL